MLNQQPQSPKGTPTKNEKEMNALSPSNVPTSPSRKTLEEQEQEKEKQRQQEITQATKAMFDNLGEYTKGELEASSSDFRLLETMNTITLEKYKEMTATAQGLTAFMQDIQKKYEEFEPYLKKIDQIDANVSELEHTVFLLDEYSKRLEEKFKRLAAQKKEVAKVKKSLQ